MLHAVDAATDGRGDPLGHDQHGKGDVEAEADQVVPVVLIKIKGVERDVYADIEVAEGGVDPAELRQVIRVLAAGDDGLVAAASGGD